MRNISDKTCRENQNTLYIPLPFFLKSCRLWNDVEKCRWQYDAWALHAGYLQLKPPRIQNF